MGSPHSSPRHLSHPLTGSAAAASCLLRREPIKTLICLHTRKLSPWPQGNGLVGEGLAEEALGASRLFVSRRRRMKKTTAEQSFIATIFTLDYPTDSLMKETDGAPKALWEEAKWGND